LTRSTKLKKKKAGGFGPGQTNKWKKLKMKLANFTANTTLKKGKGTQRWVPKAGKKGARAKETQQTKKNPPKLCFELG